MKKGFTLLELLVVIAIIGVLSSVVIVSLSNAKAKARDAKRIQDLSQIKTALDLYYNNNGYYPQTGCGWDCNDYRYGYSSASWNILAADLAPYLSILPVDPINSSCPPWQDGCYSYTYGNVGRNAYNAQYDLTAQLESTSNPLRCSIMQWVFYFNTSSWCGPYSVQIYEASGN